MIGHDFTTGVSGNLIPADLIQVKQIQIGDLTLQDRIVRRQDSTPFNCLVGNDVLQTQSVYIDFQANKVFTGMEAPATNSFPLTVYDGKWSGFAVDIAGAEYDSIWDTGAGFTLVDPAIVARYPEHFKFVKKLEMGDVTGGAGEAVVYKLDSIKFGNFEFKDVSVVAYDLSQVQKEAPSVHVIFGYNLITQLNWYVDHLNRRWFANEPINPNSSILTESATEGKMSIDIEGFKVAAIYSDDLDKTIEFYTNVLGFEKVDDAGGGAHLRLDRGTESITIYVQGGYPRDNRSGDNSKISLVFDTPSVKAALQKVQSLKIPISLDYQEMGPGFAMMAILDPSGNQIMFMGPP